MFSTSDRADGAPGRQVHAHAAEELRVEVAAATDIGRRATNADAFILDDAAGLYAVADGIGDTPRSAAVARMVLDSLRELFGPPWSLLPPADRWASEAADRLVLGAVQANGRLYVPERERRVGATFAAVVACRRHLCIGYAGDSRVYLVRPSTGRIARLTEDNTVMNEALWRGVAYDAAETMPQAHALTRAIGIRRAIEIRPLSLQWMPGDVVVLCTDGVTDCLNRTAIAETIGDGADLRRSAEWLVERALATGAGDNATTVLVRWAR